MRSNSRSRGRRVCDFHLRKLVALIKCRDDKIEPAGLGLCNQPPALGEGRRGFLQAAEFEAEEIEALGSAGAIISD